MDRCIDAYAYMVHGAYTTYLTLSCSLSLSFRNNRNNKRCVVRDNECSDDQKEKKKRAGS